MSEQPELLVLNAAVWTDGAVQRGADALAVSGARITAVGWSRDLARLAGPATRVLDARGATLTPALTDAHIHLVHWARSHHEVDLTGSASVREALERVRVFLGAHPGAEPVVGRGWDANGWSETPERTGLDAVSGDRPVVLHSKDFHALWVNSAALSRCAIGAGKVNGVGASARARGLG